MLTLVWSFLCIFGRCDQFFRDLGHVRVQTISYLEKFAEVSFLVAY